MNQGKRTFARYWKDEWMSGPTAWRKSLRIPDAHVVMEGKCAKVIELEDQDSAHLIWNPGSEYAICDCSWAKMGNLCEHIFKIIKFFRDKGSISPSVSMFQYSRALINMLHCPPFDSLVRDHAVTLAIWVQMQLNSQITPKSKDEGNTMQQQTVEPSVSSPYRILDDIGQSPNKAISSQVDNQSRVKRKRTGCEAGDFGDSLIHQLTSENVDHNGAQLEISTPDMEVDSSSICTSAPQLFSRDGNTSFGPSVENDADLIDGDLGTRKNFTSTDAELKATDGFKNQEKNHYLTMVEVEPESTANLLSADNSLDPLADTLQTGSTESDAGINISSTTVDVNRKIESPTTNTGVIVGLTLSDSTLNSNSKVDDNPSAPRAVVSEPVFYDKATDVVEEGTLGDVGNENAKTSSLASISGTSP
ncbi:UNVERIFIED_CONTAM: hypothetical protein Sradi_2810300 [Sesamum radiatum]|uniref:SWIM-type domain-containing protein n=1 Tax=Sesamum radiatum TaxID=300843 RepID=A0AAW2RVE5_SESRA